MKEIIKSLDKNFAIIEKDEQVGIYSGKIHKLSCLKELEKLQEIIRSKIVFITPFCLAREEKGYDVIGDECIIAMEVENEIIITRDDILSVLPNDDIIIGDIETDVSDDEFGELVQKTKENINVGVINQLVLSRKFYSKLDIDIEVILSIYYKLLQSRGQYMTFLFNTFDNVFIGASPEKHLFIENSNIVMNPIAGTLGKGYKSDFYSRLLDLLQDDKEIGELAQVIDEELKMISRSSIGGNIEYPLLKEVGGVIHTEANLNGIMKKNISIIDAFRETMYAPTLVGGPIESAFREIAKFEQNSRGYYGGAFGIIGEDFLDTAIVIRTAFIDKINSILTVRAGAGIVKDSDSYKEAKETILKANGFFGAIIGVNSSNNESYLGSLTIDENIEIKKILEQRKSKLSSFYTSPHLYEDLEIQEIKGKRFILINNGDDFVFLSGFMIEKMGGTVDIVDNKDFDIGLVDMYDIVLLGPGYGDINDLNDEKMVNLLKITKNLISQDMKILGICLGHQAVCKTKGYSIEKQDKITQGEQLDVNIKGNKYVLGFYNSYSPVLEGNDNKVETFLGNRVLNYKEENISSTQSHPESIMSIDGFNMLKNMILDLLK